MSFLPAPSSNRHYEMKHHTYDHLPWFCDDTRSMAPRWVALLAAKGRDEFFSSKLFHRTPENPYTGLAPRPARLLLGTNGSVAERTLQRYAGTSM